VFCGKSGRNGSWTEHYLNNVLPNRFAYFDREWGVYKILLEGDENVKCVYDPLTTVSHTVVIKRK
jgi:hypothetical protein